MKKAVLLTLAVFLAVISFAQDAAEKINQANEALKAQDYAKAYALYDEAMSNLGDVQVDSTINFNIGYAAYKSNNLEGAIKYFDKAIEVGANVSKSYEYKALMYNENKDYAKAEENFEKAIETSEDGDTDALVYNAAIAAYRANMLDKAAVLFGKSVDNGYKAETALYYKAVVLKKLDKDEAYKTTLKEGVEKFPTDSKIASALANVYVSEGNELYKKGAAILTAANKKISDGSLKTTDDAYLAEVEKAKAEFRNAVEVLEKAQKLDASNENVKKLMDACKAIL